MPGVTVVRPALAATPAASAPGDFVAASGLIVSSDKLTLTLPSATDWPCIPGYEILGELGRGGMGVVYKARQTALGRIVALKMILSGSQAGASELARFRTEAQALARLQHPNIVQIFEVGEHVEGGVARPYVALEFVDGGSLAERARSECLPVADSARLLETLARAVHFAHEHGVIHRDLKPANVLLGVGQAFQPDSSRPDDASGSGRVRLESLTYVAKITDFGLAKTLDSDSAHHTRSGQVVGTPSYMAPEQATAHGPLGPHTDVYALGVILYELVAGRLPFVAASPIEVMLQVTTQQPPPPSRFAPRLPRDLQTIILACLQKEPSRRYPSALALAEDLRRFLAHEPILARPVSSAERVWRWVRRRPAIAALLSLVVLSVVGLLVGGVVVAHQQSQAATEARSGLRQAQESFDRGELEDARRHLQAARAIAHNQGLADLLDQADQLGAKVNRRLSARRTLASAQRARDEALFEATLASDPAAVAQARRRVLSVLTPLANPDTSLEQHEQDEIQKIRYELLLVLADLTAQPRPDSTVEQTAEAVAAALALLDQASRLGPPTQAFHLRKARYLASAGHADLAAREADRARGLPPTNELDHYLVGGEYYRRREWEKAARSFVKSLQLREEQFWPRYFLALCHARQGNFQAARDNLTSCLTQKKMVWVYLMRGFVSGQLGQNDDAIADYDSALAILRERAGPAALYALYNNRAVTSLGHQKYDDARKDLERAIQLEPHQYQAHVTLSHVYLTQKDNTRALAALDRAVECAVAQHGRKQLDTTTLVLLYRSRHRLLVDHDAPDPKRALADLQAVIDLLDVSDAEKARAHRDRGWLLQRQEGQLGEAVAAYRLALALAPGDLLARRSYAEALLQQKDDAAALAAFDEFIRAGGKADVNTYRGRAQARLRLGQPDKALGDLTLALALADDPVLRGQRARIYLGCKAYALAERDFDEVIAKTDADATAFEGRGRARLHLKQPRQAADDFTRAIRLDSKNGPAYQGRALARLQLGEAAEAVADAEQSARLIGDARGGVVVAGVLAQAAERLGRSTSKRDECLGRAVVLLGQAVEKVPADERGRFWREVVRADAALAPLHGLDGYVKLQRKYGRVQ